MSTEVRTITVEEWEAEGAQLFGENIKEWKFKCPVCGHVATPNDWRAARAPFGAIAFSCLGRWKKGVGCDYAGGGLFRLNPVMVKYPEGEVGCFEFAN
jgi:hypothetical protein